VNRVFIEAVGLAAPGLPSWEAAQPILRGTAPYVAAPLPPYTPNLLPPNERRRSTATVRLAFQAGEDALRRTSLSAQELATVFASSDADLNIIHRICSALAATPRVISPTDFHNSVHNAAAGYWSIAVGARSASTSISAHDYSFALGLAEACGSVCVDGLNTLLIAFDLPPPEPLYAKRPIAAPVASALLLTKDRTSRSLAALSWAWSRTETETSLTGELEVLRLSNPAARALPLLGTLARGVQGRIVLAANRELALAVDLQLP